MAAAKSVREMIRDIQREAMAPEDLLPERAAELLVRATALIANCNDEIRMADQRYAVVLLQHLESSEAANRARIKAETTPEYDRKRQARDAKELLVEVARSLKFFLRAKADEMRLS